MGAYYAYATCRAFRHDVMEKVFLFLTFAFLLVGGVAAVLLIGSLAGMGDYSIHIMLSATLGSFALILVGLIPLFRWIGGSKGAKSAL